MWRCVVCYVFVALTLKSLLSHIHVTHSRSPDFRVLCGIDGCAKEYRVYNSFWYHVKRCHEKHLLASGSAASSRACQAGRRRPETIGRTSIDGNEGRTFGASGPTVTMNNGDRATSVGEPNALQPLAENATTPEHFGVFDTTRSVFSGFSNQTISRPTQGSTATINSTSITLVPYDDSLGLPTYDDSSTSCNYEVSVQFL